MVTKWIHYIPYFCRLIFKYYTLHRYLVQYFFFCKLWYTKDKLKLNRLILSGKLVTNHLDRRVEFYSLKNFWWVIFNVMQLLSYLKNTYMTLASSSVLKCALNVTLAFNNMMLMHIYYTYLTFSERFIIFELQQVFLYSHWFSQYSYKWIDSKLRLFGFHLFMSYIILLIFNKCITFLYAYFDVFMVVYT